MRAAVVFGGGVGSKSVVCAGRGVCRVGRRENGNGCCSGGYKENPVTGPGRVRRYVRGEGGRNG